MKQYVYYIKSADNLILSIGYMDSGFRKELGLDNVFLIGRL